MSGYTEHYNLKKPAQSENYNVEDANTNNTIIDAILFGKVDKVAGKDLSSNDFTNEYKLKLDAMGKIYNYLGTVQNLDALGKIENSKKGDLYHVQSESADYAWNGTKWEKVDSNKGDTGVGITEIKCQESTDDSGINVITIKLSDGRETSFNVRNGTKGKTGEKGETGDTGPRGETGSYPVLISTATGNPVHIENSSDLTMKLKLNGGHQQKKTEGYNILDYITNLKSENDGLKNTLNKDGSITTTGVPSVNYAKVTSGINLYDKLEDKKTYTLKQGEVQTGILYLQVDALKADGTHTYINNSQNGEVTFTVDKTTYTKYTILIQSGLTSAWGTSSKTITNTYMLYEGTDDKEFEPYTGSQASPNVDYLQEVETVGDNVNIIDVNNFTQALLNVNDGTLILNQGWRCTDYLDVLYKEYNFSWESDSPLFQVKVCFYDKGKNFLSSLNYLESGIYSKSFKVPNGSRFMRLSYSINVNSVAVAREKIKLEKGTKATPYSPYGEGNVGVIKQNKNFLYYEAQNQSISGINYTVNSDKSIQVSGTATAVSDFYLIGSATNYEGTNLRGAYKISGCNSGTTSKYMLYVEKKNEYGTLEYYQNVSGDTEINIAEGDTLRIFIRVLSGVTVNDTIYPMLRLSTETDDTYVEAKKERYIMPIQQEMLEGDYIDNVEHHEWDKLILTGDENWYCESNGRMGYLVQNLPKAYKKTVQTSDLLGNVCSSYIEKTPSQTWAGTQGFCIDPAGSLRIWDDTYSKTSDLAGFKAMLAEKYNAGNPVVCYLKLATPIELELTKEQKEILNLMKTYKNETNIIADNELATMEVEYQTDAEVNELLNEQKEKMWGVGSIYTTTLEEDPAIILGLGKWIRKKILNGGELIAYGSAYNQGEQSDTVVNGAKLDFSDTKIPNKKFNIKNFVDGVLFDQGGTFKIATKGIVGLVKCNSKFCGLGGSGITGLWWQGNSNPLPTGVNLLSTNALLTGPYGEVYGGNTNTLLYEVTDEASDETEFYVNPVVNPYGGAFAPCQAGTKCSLEVEVYSKKQTTYVWERIS